MKLVIVEELPRPCNMIALHASGCFGDGDESWSKSRQFPDTEEGREEALLYTRMYFRLTPEMVRDLETVEDMQEWLEEEKLVDDGTSLEIPCDESEYLPCVEEVRVLLYDKDGRTFKMKLGY